MPALRAPREIRDIRVTLWRLHAYRYGRRAKFFLQVDNRSAAPVETFTYARAPGASGTAEEPAVVTVPGFASLGIKLVLAMPRRGLARAVTEVQAGDETLLFSESERPRQRFGTLLLLLVALLGAALWFAFGGVTPSVTALAVPAEVLASRPFPVAYVLARANEAAYTVVSARGRVAASGTIAGEQGTFDVALPATQRIEIYTVRLTARGRFRDVARSARVIAEPDPTPVEVPRPRRVARARASAVRPFGVDLLALAKDTVAGGKPVTVYYRVGSVDGLVRLIDQYGTVRAEALLDRRGDSILVAPFVDTDQDFRVVLHAARGSAQAEKSVALRVTRERSLDDVLATARRKNDGPIALVNATVAPGDPIEVGIAHYVPGLRVALVDPNGQEIASTSVGDDQNEVTLTAPAIAGTAKYTVTATYKNGESEETIVRDVTIGAAPAPPTTL